MAKGQSSRQRMINLMYLVFIAMMALNVSTEVLDGFDIVNDNLNKTVKNTVSRNSQLYADLNEYYANNPTKVEGVHDESVLLKQKSDSLFNYLQFLKEEVARKTDGKEANVNKLENRENIDAGSEVMLAPVIGEGNKLKSAIDTYRKEMIQLITEPKKKELVASSLSTEPNEKAKKDQKDWITASFDRMPSIAVISYLTGLQASVKQAEAEVLTSLLNKVDGKDLRVNQMNAFVIPESNFVMAGAPYKATIRLAAVDTTQQPRIFVNGKELAGKDGVLSIPTSRPGANTVSGYIEVKNRDGEVQQHKFTQQYSVMEAMATIAPAYATILYAGTKNEMTISVPGVPNKDVSARVSGSGTLQRVNDAQWIAVPSQVGGKFAIEVYAKRPAGGEQFVAKQEFKVKALPNATPYISYTDDKGNKKRFKRGKISRSILLNATGVNAAIDDGILDVPFNVLGFKTIIIDAMGNAMQEVSNGGNFSQKQISQIQRLSRGKIFFITEIRAIGPDKVQQELGTMEVRLN